MERTGFLTIASSLQGGMERLPEVLRCGAAKGPCDVPSLVLAAVSHGSRCKRPGRNRRRHGLHALGPAGPDHANARAAHVDLRQRDHRKRHERQRQHDRSLQNADEGCRRAGRREVGVPSGVTISLGSGNYDAANGEKFPIVIPRSVSISGTNYGAGPSSGSFVDGFGEDTIFEQIVHTARHSVYTTVETVPPAKLSLGNLYIGASKITLPTRALYASVDVIGTLSGAVASFGAGFVSRGNNLNGILVASGSLTCDTCQIRGNGFGIGALTVPLPTTSPSSGAPSITLTHTSHGDSTVGAKVADILTDGSANVNASGATFARQGLAYADTFAPVVPTSIRGSVDFGGGVSGSSGGNGFIGARTTEILVTRRNETVSALDDTWNPNQQRANRNGKYTRTITFGSGTTGKNVTIVHAAVGSTVTVGPAPAPTPTPSTTPSGSPIPTSTPT